MSTIVWYITDEKPGHRNQLLGLQEALQRQQGWSGHWLSVIEEPLSFGGLLLGRHPHQGPAPDLVVGAGHRTHTTLLSLKRQYGVFTAVLMKPSLPLSWFDAAIIPRHDGAATGKIPVLLTDGVLNRIQPTPAADRDPARGLILMGGESRHYHFDSADLLTQVRAIIESRPDVHWHLSDSRRTPDSFMAALRSDCPAQLTLYSHHNTGPDWLGEEMAAASVIWVSPDSVSMIYEALTSGAPVGLLAMPEAATKSRVVEGIEQLLAAGKLTRFQAGGPQPTRATHSEPLWEAERAASWLAGQLRERR